jgi:RimJ/RimL family protein N-acetyltransferase
MADTPDFEFRQARSSDREAVLALCAKIWDGDDYLPGVFDSWAADREGELCLCIDSGKLVGLAKLSWLGPGEAWLEGLRKDPDSGVTGVGRALCSRFLSRLAKIEGLRYVRFSTYFQNTASIRLNESLGFRVVERASLKELRSESLADPERRARPDRSALVSVLRDPARILPFVEASGWFGPYMHECWRSYPWSEERFVERYVKPGRCLALVEGGRVRALAACLVDEEKREGSLPFFDAEDWSAAAVLMGAVESRLRAERAPYASAIVPSGGGRARALLDALDWRSWEQEEDYLLFELPIERLAEYRS